MAGLLFANMDNAMQKRYQELLFQRYGKNKKHLLSKQDYYEIIENIKNASQENAVKSRQQYFWCFCWLMVVFCFFGGGEHAKGGGGGGRRHVSPPK